MLEEGYGDHCERRHSDKASFFGKSGVGLSALPGGRFRAVHRHQHDESNIGRQQEYGRQSVGSCDLSEHFNPIEVCGSDENQNTCRQSDELRKEREVRSIAEPAEPWPLDLAPFRGHVERYHALARAR
jgi:hypothetical protein